MDAGRALLGEYQVGDGKRVIKKKPMRGFLGEGIFDRTRGVCGEVFHKNRWYLQPATDSGEWKTQCWSVEKKGRVKTRNIKRAARSNHIKQSTTEGRQLLPQASPAAIHAPSWGASSCQAGVSIGSESPHRKIR
jgi:hypothetical protein